MLADSITPTADGAYGSTSPGGGTIGAGPPIGAPIGAGPGITPGPGAGASGPPPGPTADGMGASPAGRLVVCMAIASFMSLNSWPGGKYWTSSFCHQALGNVCPLKSDWHPTAPAITARPNVHVSKRPNVDDFMIASPLSLVAA